jgi:4-alpha-glucanotransferase
VTAVARSDRQLSELARLRGVQLGYTGHDGKRVVASRDTLREVLGALGYPAADPATVSEELERARAERDGHGIDPVFVVRPNGAVVGALSLAAAGDWESAWLSVELETGGVQRRRLSEVATRQPADGARRAALLNLAGFDIPPGYHQLAVEIEGRRTTALLLAPPKPAAPPVGGLGIFSPTYALRSATSDWGVGSYADLAEFADWVGASGGQLAGTLPLLATFTDAPMDPSPYLPVSRQFWSDVFIDVDSLPEFRSSAAAKAMRTSAANHPQTTVDYDEVVACKRAVLDVCASELCAQPSGRREEFDRFVKAHPDLERYAEFRAVHEHRGGTWREWGSGPGRLPDEAPDAAAVRFHQYAQFVAAEQLQDAAGRAAGLYLDLPVGVHPAGYDTWSDSTLFAAAGVGAPPDAFFAGGQSWGFPPLHPDRLRADGYRYLINAYRHVLGSARAIRIDHVLGLQRMFWIPDGSSAADGAYVRYPSDELRAVIAIEAGRADAVVIGEDLGVVSPAIRHFNASAKTPLPQPEKPSAASLGGHDLPRFAAFWRGADIDDRVKQGEIGEAEAAAERSRRGALVAAVPRLGGSTPDDDLRAAYATCVGALAGGPASYLFLDVADLELDTEPDNRPGTGPEAGNWRQRLRRPLAAIAEDDAVTAVVADVAARRSTVRQKGPAR